MVGCLLLAGRGVPWCYLEPGEAEELGGPDGQEAVAEEARGLVPQLHVRGEAAEGGDEGHQALEHELDEVLLLHVQRHGACLVE